VCAPPRAVYSGPKWPTTWFGGGTLATVRTVWSTLILRPSRLTRVERQSATNDLLDSVRYLHEDATYPRYITGIIDNRDERVATYQYDSAGRVILTEGADGTGTKAVAYSNPGTARVRKVTNDFGKEDTFTFSQFSASQKDYRLTSLSGAATADTPATAASLTYGSNTFISSTTDAEGRLTTMVRDARGRPTTIVEASGTPAARTTTITWHPNFNVPASIAIPGLTETRTYDAQGRLATVTLTDTTSHTVPYATAGQSRTSSFVWDANGRLLSVNGPLAATAAGDDITSFTYDTQGNLLTATNPLGQVVTYAGYGPDGRAGLVTDVNGVQTAFAYDALGRVLSVTLKHPTDPLQDTVTSMAYDAVGNVTAMTLPGTATLSFEYDAANRMTAMFAADGERWSFAYDEMDNVVSERVRRSDGTSFATIARAFDDLGRLIRVASGTDSAAAEWAYDKVGNVTATTSPNGFTTAASFDALDRVISTVAPDTGTSALSYDAQDNPLSFTDPIAVTTQFTYNGFGEVIQEVSPDRGTSTYWYDAAGQLVQASDGRGQVVIYERDLLGRMTKMTPVGRPASEVVTYTWDTGGITGSYRVGRLTRMVDGSGTTLFSYDHRGDLLIKRQVIGTSTSAQLSYAYDAAGRIIRITYPSGRQVRYGYDAKGRVASVDTRASGGTTAWTPVAGSTLYEPFGPVRAMLLGNGLAVGNVWGQDGSLASRQLTSAASGTDLSHLSYRYDADGNIGAITDHLNPAASVVYGYDPVGRLVLTVSDTAPVAAQSYSYTSGTNRLASFSDSSGTRTISYDARGNTVSETRPGGITVNAGYDGYGRLISYNRSNTGAQSYTYNGLDDRVRVDKPTGTRSFVYDADGRVMGEYGTSATDVKAEFIWALPSLAANDNSPFGGSDVIGGYTPLAVASPAGSGPGPVELFWVHGNHLGVPVVYTNASGTAVAPPGDYLLPGFPGQLRVMADLYYNRYRDYDPVTGRYIQADPIGLAGGANGYIYAGANPVNMIDPDGLSPQDWFESGQFFGIAMAADALGAANARNAGRGDVFCYDPWDVAFGFGASMVTGYGLGKLGKFLFSFRGNLPSGLGDLTRKEQEDIQRVVDRAGRPLDVVGSAARGKRRGRGADLPIGKGKDGKSDIDYVAPSNSHPYFRDFRENLPDLDPKHGIIPGPPDPHQGPSIRFEPGNKPRFVPGG
jgi:RHS repeat-associated protein